MKKRGLSRDFLDAMREKLECGRRKGSNWWDWHLPERRRYRHAIKGHKGILVKRLLEEVIELVIAIESKDRREIRLEAADVANLAMMIATAEDALDE